MLEITEIFERRTAADIVFDRLQQEITALKLLPGTKLSESEVAKRFGVSRQPVRDAFSRLASLDMLLIRPQKATEVRRFSMQRIAHARFVRLSVELEVIRSACAVWNGPRAKVLDDSIAAQRAAIDSADAEQFHALDYAFHTSLCELAGHPLASETIEASKLKVDRLCVLSLGRAHEADALWGDHRAMAAALKRKDAEAACAAVRKHLSRLDDTIADIHAAHADYFE
ncbi:MAG: GntR family transcriptional regulator [Pseudomonadota bacterium]